VGLVDQKWAVQRAVQDREAQHKTVEAILADAALANAQLAVAKAVMRSAASAVRSATSAVKAEFRREEAAVEAEETVEQIIPHLVFGRVPAGVNARQRRGRPEVKVVYFRSLFEAEGDDNSDTKAVLPPADQPVQLAMFAP